MVPVVGNYYRTEAEHKQYNQLRSGSSVSLVFDRDNKYDVNAIKVVSNERYTLGFLSMSDAALIAKMLRTAIEQNESTICMYDIRGKFSMTAVVNKPASISSRLILEIKSVTLK